MPVSDMLSRMTSQEITEWMAFANVEPIGDRRADIRNAQLMTILGNANRDTDAHPEPFSLAEFLHDWWAAPDTGEIHEESWKTNLQKLEVIGIALGITPTQGEVQ